MIKSLKAMNFLVGTSLFPFLIKRLTFFSSFRDPLNQKIFMLNKNLLNRILSISCVMKINFKVRHFHCIILIIDLERDRLCHTI